MRKKRLVKKKRNASIETPYMEKLPKVQARVQFEFDAKIDQAVLARKEIEKKAGRDPRLFTKEKWVIEALAAYLAYEYIDPGDVGPLAGLELDDRERVDRLIKFLRAAPEGLKKASDLGHQVLRAALKELERKR